jgi:hypothetical protein
MCTRSVRITWGSSCLEYDSIRPIALVSTTHITVADDALFGFESLDELLKQEIPAWQNELILRYRESALDRPIMRKCTKAGGVTDEPMPKAAFTDTFRNMLRNAGYLCTASIHAIRQQLGKKVDERYTEVRRSQYLAQAAPRIFWLEHTTVNQVKDRDSPQGCGIQLLADGCERQQLDEESNDSPTTEPSLNHGG